MSSVFTSLSHHVYLLTQVLVLFSMSVVKQFLNALNAIHSTHKMSFYAVARGFQVGIYNSWAQCEKQVKNFKGAKYKKFPTRQEAELFIKNVDSISGSSKNVTQFRPEDIAIALGSKTGLPDWSATETSETMQQNQVEDFWPENDGEEVADTDNLTDADLLLALAEVEGVDETLPTTASSIISGQKRKVADSRSSSRSKQLKHDSIVWQPIGLKTVGSYEFQIDSEGFVIVYTDGSCLNNGRPDAVAGFGVYFDDDHPLNAAKPVIGRATNNVGEIQATIYAIKVAKDLGIDKLCISTDSQFLINSITTWIKGWKRKNWRLANGSPVKNVDDFKMLDDLLMDDTIAVKWNYVKAHMGIKGNEMADKLAKEGSELYKQLHLNQ